MLRLTWAHLIQSGGVGPIGAAVLLPDLHLFDLAALMLRVDACGTAGRHGDAEEITSR
ncbi:MAG: hypothetical protein HYX75_10625 [Acidobacteria bacterium]|nr:hypothetical protein [Acidobacteriota bacterium]